MIRPRRAAGRTRPAAVRRNRAIWERTHASYERRHRRALAVAGGASWGLYRVPEKGLGLLGDVRGARTLELGCGSATWSAALARRGARAVAVDASRARLRQAAATIRRRRVTVALAEADAHRLPFGANRFDLAFCDWGALTFADPYATLPEVARVLRPGGRLVFSTSSPFRVVTTPRDGGPQARRLSGRYFGMHRFDYPESTEFHLGYGAWVDAFRANGFTVERLVEIPAPPGPPSTYLSKRDHAWGQRWPMEIIWAVRRGPEGAPPARRRLRPGAGSGP